MNEEYDRYKVQNFWTVSTTAMRPDEAERAAHLIEVEFPQVRADVVDPRNFYGVFADRFTTEMLKDALLSLQKDGGNVRNMLGDVEQWLEIAEPYGDSSEIYQPVNWKH